MTEVVVGWVGGGRGGVSLTHLITVHRNRDLDAKTCRSARRIQSACIRALRMMKEMGCWEKPERHTWAFPERDEALLSHCPYEIIEGERTDGCIFIIFCIYQVTQDINKKTVT